MMRDAEVMTRIVKTIADMKVGKHREMTGIMWTVTDVRVLMMTGIMQTVADTKVVVDGEMMKITQAVDGEMTSNQTAVYVKFTIMQVKGQDLGGHLLVRKLVEAVHERRVICITETVVVMGEFRKVMLGIMITGK